MRSMKAVVTGESPDSSMAPSTEIEGRSGLVAMWQPEDPSEDEYPHGTGNVQIWGGAFPLEEIAILKAVRNRTVSRCRRYLQAGEGIRAEQAEIRRFLQENDWAAQAVRTLRERSN